MSRSRERRRTGRTGRPGRPRRLRSVEIVAIGLVSVALLGWSGVSIRSLIHHASARPSLPASGERAASQSVFYEAAFVSCLDVLWIGWLVGRLKGGGDGSTQAVVVRGRARRRRRREEARSIRRDPQDEH